MYMRIDTKYLGEMDIDKEKIIQFETGLPGFLEEKEFIILDIPGNDLLQLLQSLQTPNLAFFVANPHQFDQTYHFKLPDNIVESLDITSKEEVVILSILTVNDPFDKSTINLQAPIVINSEKKTAKQIILNDENYAMKTPIAFSNKEKRGD